MFEVYVSDKSSLLEIELSGSSEKTVSKHNCVGTAAVRGFVLNLSAIDSIDGSSIDHLWAMVNGGPGTVHLVLKTCRFWRCCFFKSEKSKESPQDH